MIKNNREANYDIVIVGAGPSGLSSAIFAARAGFKVLVVEKGKQAAPDPRGETLHEKPICTELLGEGFMKSLALNETAGRCYNSPNCKKNFYIGRSSPSIVFEWRKFIDRLVEVAEREGVEIRTNSEVLEAIIDDGICKGVTYRNGEGKINKVFSPLVLGCDGAPSTLGRQFGFGYENTVCPMVKCLLKHANYKNKYFEYFFISHGSVPKMDDFPPGSAYIFPRDKDNAEVGLMIFTEAAKKIGIAMPDDETIMRAWENLKAYYPKFSEIFDGSEIVYEHLTNIPSAGLLEPAIPVPGLILMGDSVGFVEASGSSGLIADMTIAKFWITLMKEKSISRSREMWSEANIRSYLDLYHKNDMYKHIAKVYKYIRKSKIFLFGKKKNAKSINRRWWLVKLAYKLM